MHRSLPTLPSAGCRHPTPPPRRCCCRCCRCRCCRCRWLVALLLLLLRTKPPLLDSPALCNQWEFLSETHQVVSLVQP